MGAVFLHDVRQNQQHMVGLQTLRTAPTVELPPVQSALHAEDIGSSVVV